MEAEVRHMSAEALGELLSVAAAAGAEPDAQLMDVREPDEWATARLPHFKLYPTSAASSWADGIADLLDKSQTTIVLCHHGVRSYSVASFLVGKGFTDVVNVTGGIDAYSRSVDRSVPMY
jgi:rhodanese-related sulfurtransferase